MQCATLQTHIERLLLDLHSDRPDAPEGGQGEAGRDGDAGDGRHLQALQMLLVLGIELHKTGFKDYKPEQQVPGRANKFDFGIPHPMGG